MQRPFSRLISAVALTLVCSSPAPIVAQTAADDAANTAWQLDAMIHMQRMRVFHDVDTTAFVRRHSTTPAHKEARNGNAPCQASDDRSPCDVCGCRAAGLSPA